jgi:zinc and cadmium transporter
MTDPNPAPAVLLAVYCGLILLASLAGGWIPLVLRLTHTRLQVAISFVAGLMLGVGLLHLLPHAWQQLQSMDRAAGWLLAGFVVMFFIQRFLHFHHHDVPEEVAGNHASADHAHAEAHRGQGHTLAEQSARRLSWTTAALGLTLHTLIDGVALAASVEAEPREDGTGWLMGFGTFLVIILHKPFDAMAIGTLMAASERPRYLRHVVNALFALAIPVGVLLFHFGARQYAGAAEQFVGAALAFVAGTFLCISTSDLLPELQFHAHDRIKLSCALVAGLLLSALIGFFETSGHERFHAPAHRPLTVPPAGTGK